MRMWERQLTEVVEDSDKYLFQLFNMISVYKFCVIYGICLCLMAESLIFDMMLNTAFEDGIDTIEDLIDMDIRLGNYSG